MIQLVTSSVRFLLERSVFPEVRIKAKHTIGVALVDTCIRFSMIHALRQKLFFVFPTLLKWMERVSSFLFLSRMFDPVSLFCLFSLSLENDNIPPTDRKRKRQIGRFSPIYSSDGV